jgi:Holliday junction resolvasome RuvABC endonuclease subunit
MAGEIFVLGVDPGLRHFGWAMVALTGSTEQVYGMGVIKTVKSDNKRGLLVADDNVRCAREVATVLRSLTKFKGGIKAFCAEAMSAPRNASAAAKMAMTWGIVACLAEEKDIPIVQASPQELKKKVCDNKSASKEEVQKALTDRYGMFVTGRPVLPLSLMLEPQAPLLSDVPGGQHEHAWDALAAVVAGLDSEVVRLARRMVA